VQVEQAVLLATAQRQIGRSCHDLQQPKNCVAGGVSAS
jgi:hypothetical protein